MATPASYRELVLRGQPQLYAPADEAVGSTVVGDVSGYGLNGATNTGAGQPTRAVAGPLSDGTPAIRLDGVDDTITFGDVIDFGLTDWTIEFWIRTSAVPAEQGIVGKYATLTPFRPFWEIMLTDDGAEAGKIRAGYDDGSGTILSCYGPQPINDGAWHYVCCVFSRAAGITVWTDGDARFQAGTRLLAMDSNGVLRVGGNGAEAGPRLAADFGQLAAYKYALSDEQARARNTWGRISLPVVVADPAAGSIAALDPVTLIEVDFDRDPGRMRYRRAVLATAPDHYYPFDGVTALARQADFGGYVTPVALAVPATTRTTVRGATSGASVSNGGGNWTNPGNVAAEDASFATYTNGVNAPWLEAQFAGLIDRIPEGATITALTFRVKGKVSAGTGSLTARIITPLGTSASTSMVGALSTVNANVTVAAGAPMNALWNQALTRDSFADGGFKFQVEATAGAGAISSLDYVEVTVTYTQNTAVVDTSHKLQEDVNDQVILSPNYTGTQETATEWAIEWWMRPFTATPPASQTLLNAFNFTVTYMTTGKLRMDGGGGSTVDSPAILGTVWRHIFIICAKDKMKLYIDGDQVATLDSTTFPTGSAVTAGTLIIGPGFSGRFDELALYSYAPDDTIPAIHFRSALSTDAVVEHYLSITSRVRGFTVTKRRANETEKMQAGELRATVDNSDGALEPENESSPYYPNVRSSRPVRVRDRYPANFAEDSAFDLAIGTKWTATQTLGTVAAQIGGQAPPVGNGNVVRAVRNAASSASYLSVTMVDQIPVEPDVPLTVSFYAKKGNTDTPSPKLSVKLYEIDARQRNHGARTVSAVATAVAGAVYPNGADAAGWQRYAATFLLSRSTVAAILELVLIDTPTTNGTLTVYASGVQVEYGGALHGWAAGAWYEEFTGAIEQFPAGQPSHRRATIELVGNDGRQPLLADVTRGSAPVELSGARIGRLLDRGLWRTDKRLIDTGIQTLAADKYGGDEPLSKIEQAATDSELGLFFIDGSARAVFHDQGHRNRVTRSAYARARFGDGDDAVELPYVSVATDNGEALIRNKVIVNPIGTTKDGDPLSNAGVALTLAPGPNGGTDSATISVPGVKIGDAIIATPASTLGGVIWNANVSAPDVVTILATNPTAGVLSWSTTWRIDATPEPGVQGNSAFDYLSSVRHGTRPLERDTALVSTTVAVAQAETLLARYREPRKRFSSMVIEPRRDRRLWPVVLSSEISDLITVVRRLTQMTEREYRDMIVSDQPAAYWPLEDVGGNGATIIDEIGRTGTVTNGLSPGVAVNGVDVADSPVRTRLGVRSLDGTGDYVTVGDVPGVRWAGNVTWEAWIKPTLDVRRVIMGKSYAGEGLLQVEPTGQLLYWYGSHGAEAGAVYLTNFEIIGSSGLVPSGVWTHVAVVRDVTNTKVRLFINGVLDVEATAHYTPALSTQPFYIGHGGDGSDFRGSIGHVAVYPFAATASRMLVHANAKTGYGMPGDNPEIRNAYLEGYTRTTSLQGRLKTTYDLALSQ